MQKIKKTAYNEQLQRLRVQFEGGGDYFFFEVPPRIAKIFQSVPNEKARIEFYLNQINGRYPSTDKETYFRERQGGFDIPVKSSNIKAIRFDPDNIEIPPEERIGPLTVTFTSGAVYRYSAVEQATYERVVFAASVGSRFNELVKGGWFEYEKVE